jgi:hypothetical protein
MYLVRAELRKHLREQLEELQDQGGIDFEYIVDEEQIVNMLEEKINSDTHKHKKMMLRLELEFETLNAVEMREVLDVQTLQFEQDLIMKDYASKIDPSYTTAHFKAGRKIFKAL